ncbi:homoserine/homoserine lactone efflux protein [Oceanospirillum multiglobuliferum]|uniref:Homoserine/homoserine lactone efflux protein n=1 Tax=Oceanospirillum multiglobuliferum TaxID=64969 RepID=A0A1T4S9W2_9GAMM|nr:homoserine/homoserine lactone efflux protein [Oceanospirillum multiglobuliferum]OPX54357.1 homoserine/homoserine lactone efflux protein [Oceanospirillum multiglobuliferum]SKA24886.1 homoserine/homoserine lactone efflux protein [Oceanospirillum multiglobuliferum]
MTLELFLAFLVASLLISISPGAGAVNTMSNGLKYGVWQSLPAILGLQLGYGAQVVIVGVGLGALLASSEIAFSTVKWLGAAYLIWLGYQKWREQPVALKEGEVSTPVSAQKRFWQAAFVNLVNPKATVFLVALFPQFLNANMPQLPQFLIMGTTLLIVDIVVMIGYASLAAKLSTWFKDPKHQKSQNRIFGGMFIAAGSALASYNR